MSRIGSLLGVPLYADECISKQLRVSYARLLVEMDITKHLPDHISIENPHDNVVEQKVLYTGSLLFVKHVISWVMTHDCNEHRRPTSKITPREPSRFIQMWIP